VNKTIVLKWVLVCTLICASFNSNAALIDSVTFTKIADTDTAVPGGTGNFTGFFNPSISNGTVTFYGANSSGGRSGIYIGNGTLGVVADLTTAIPGGTGNFTSFGTAPSIFNGSVAFFGRGSNGQQGIYADFGMGVERVICCYRHWWD
jgi:hypothetical protein